MNYTVKTNYVAPSTEVVEVKSNGFLCASPTQASVNGVSDYEGSSQTW